MKPEYDLSKLKSRKNPYPSKLKKSVTFRNNRGGLRQVLDTILASL